MENQKIMDLESRQSNEFVYSPRFFMIMYCVLSSCIILIDVIFISIYGMSDFGVAMLRPLAAILFLVVTLKSKIRIRVLVITIISFLHFGELIFLNFGFFKNSYQFSPRMILQLLFVLSILFLMPCLILLSRIDTRRIKVFTGSILIFLLIGLFVPIWDVTGSIAIDNMTGIHSLTTILHNMDGISQFVKYQLSFFIFIVVITSFSILVFKNAMFIYGLLKYMFIAFILAVPLLNIFMPINFMGILRIYANYVYSFSFFFLFAFGLVELIVINQYFGIRSQQTDNQIKLAEPVIEEVRDN